MKPAPSPSLAILLACSFAFIIVQLDVTIVIMFGVLVNFSYYGVIFVLSFYLQKVRGYMVMETGAGSASPGAGPGRIKIIVAFTHF